MKKPAFYLSLAVVWLGACAPRAALGTTPPRIDTGVSSDRWGVIPAGGFFQGQHDHQIDVDYDYQMMLTDVTNAQYADYLNAALEDGTVLVEGSQIEAFYPGDAFHNHKHEVEVPSGNWAHVPLDDPGLRLDYEGGRLTAKAGYENHPMVLVSWFGAKAYCDYYGWRLPTEIEWEKAARGIDNRPFPWGDTIGPENANFYSSHDLFEKIIAGQGDSTPVGFYNGRTYQGFETIDSPSPFGLYDMAGNVWQWTGDVYEGTHLRYLRGGSRFDYAYNLRVWTRNSAGPDYYSPSIGFRCARSGG